MTEPSLNWSFFLLASIMDVWWHEICRSWRLKALRSSKQRNAVKPRAMRHTIWSSPGFPPPNWSTNSLNLACCEGGGVLLLGHEPRMYLHASRNCFTMVCCKGDGKQAFWWAHATPKATAWMDASDLVVCNRCTRKHANSRLDVRRTMMSVPCQEGWCLFLNCTRCSVLDHDAGNCLG